MSEKLKLCPFCGGKAELCKDSHGYYYVQCTQCYSHTSWRKTEDDAVCRWNLGPENQKLRFCPNCGHQATTGGNYGWIEVNGHKKYRAYCVNCHMSSGYYDSTAEAIDAWNRRITDGQSETD